MQRELLPKVAKSPPSSNHHESEEPESPAAPSKTSRQKRNLVSVACNACRKGKVKCDGQQPKCSRCDNRETACIYPTSYSTRLNKTEDQLKEAHNEIKRLSSYITSLTGEKPDDIPELRPHLSSNSGIPEANWRQNLTTEVNGDGMNDLIHTHHSTSSQVTVFIPPNDTTTVTPSTPYQFGNLPFSSSVFANGYVRLYQEYQRKNFHVPLHQILPMNLIIEDRLSRACMTQYLQCRQFVAEGMDMESVVGDDRLDVTPLLNPGALETVHPFTQWIIQYVETFSLPERILDWRFKLGCVYCLFHLLRWLIYPTKENYARIPDVMKPTTLQLFIPHPFWMDFVIPPATRDTFLQHPDITSLPSWADVFVESTIAWPDGGLLSAITLDEDSGRMLVTDEFAAKIQQVDTWVMSPRVFEEFPSLQEQETGQEPQQR